MKSEDFEKNIRSQIDSLKQKLDNLDKTINVQEQILEVLNEDTKKLLPDVLRPVNNSDSVEEIMKSAFSKGKLPKSLLK